MKDATYFAEIACREMSQEDQVKFRPLIYNLFLQVQADAFEQAAGIVDEALKGIDVKGPGILLRATAKGIWPGHGRQDAPAANPLSAADFGGTMPHPETPPVTT